MREHFAVPKYILARDGKTRGETTGSTHRCQIEGCRGRRIAVRWPDGHFTYPCSRGLLPVKRKNNTMRIA